MPVPITGATQPPTHGPGVQGCCGQGMLLRGGHLLSLGVRAQMGRCPWPCRVGAKDLPVCSGASSMQPWAGFGFWQVLGDIAPIAHPPVYDHGAWGPFYPLLLSCQGSIALAFALPCCSPLPMPPTPPPRHPRPGQDCKSRLLARLPLALGCQSSPLPRRGRALGKADVRSPQDVEANTIRLKEHGKVVLVLEKNSGLGGHVAVAGSSRYSGPSHPSIPCPSLGQVLPLHGGAQPMSAAPLCPTSVPVLSACIQGTWA